MMVPKVLLFCSHLQTRPILYNRIYNLHAQISTHTWTATTAEDGPVHSRLLLIKSLLESRYARTPATLPIVFAIIFHHLGDFWPILTNIYIYIFFFACSVSTCEFPPLPLHPSPLPPPLKDMLDLLPPLRGG